MPSPRIIRNEDISHLQRAPGVTVSGFITKETGATEISSGITTFDPGCSNTTHYHNAEESVIVIEGEGILMINGQEKPCRCQRRRLHHPRYPPPANQHRGSTLPHSLVLCHSRGNEDAGGGVGVVHLVGAQTRCPSEGKPRPARHRAVRVSPPWPLVLRDGPSATLVAADARGDLVGRIRSSSQPPVPSARRRRSAFPP